jgi:acetylornithine deacetylase
MKSVLDTLRDMVRINSVNPAYESGVPELEIQRYVSDFFRGHGIDVVEHQVLPNRSNVIGCLPGRNPGRRLIFEAHCDTVGITGMTIPPFEPDLRDGRLYGRGACDTKAGLAAMMHALAELKAEGITPPCEVWVVSAAGEEVDGCGALRLCDGLTADAAVVSEPTDLRTAVATKGVLRWRIATRGVAAHSSKPHLGVNAIYLMAGILARLEAENERLAGREHPLVGPATLSVGVIQGGTQINIVPEHCVIEVDRRLIPGEDPQTVFEQYAGDLEAECERPMLSEFPLDTPCDAPIALLASRVLSGIGLDGAPFGVPYGSDASKFMRAGIPSIVLGPGSIDQAHTADEWVEVRQVERALAVYRRIMEGFE